MAKIYGLFGAMTGKVADVVMSVRFGEQIARKYQPVVSNPSTSGQVAQRAKLKLMSQIAAVMAPVIAIPREGAKSSRNLFVKKNFRLSTYEGDQAQITLGNIQLTKSSLSLPDITVTRGEGNTVSVRLSQTLSAVDKVVYVSFVKQADSTLRLVASEVVGIDASDPYFQAEMNLRAGSEYVIYAYGIRNNTDAARVLFGDLQAVSAETVAKLIVERQLTFSDVSLTETKGAVLPIS